MRRLVGGLLALALLGAAAPAQAGVYARVEPHEVVLGNDLVERSWDRDAFRTTALVDKRAPARTWSRNRRDFTLRIAGAEVSSEAFHVTSVDVHQLPGGGVRAEMALAGPPGLDATRIAEAYPGVAGFRTQTVLRSAVPLALSGATLDEAAVGAATPTLHAFRAGADWREPGWKGPDFTVGDGHAGDWRDTHTAPRGTALEGPGQWLSVADGGRSLFQVAQRNDLPSSRGGYDGDVAQVGVDYSRDVIFLGPLEEQAHVENPLAAPAGGRVRVVHPGVPFALEPAFTGFGNGDGDEPWQFAKFLRPAYPRAVTFNSNGTDANRISTGAKDDMDFATVQQVAPIARRLGIETFILDDGWQGQSGDWQPDPKRFPDATFSAVRQAISPMRLGLWMSPLHFNPASNAYHQHPDSACAPVGHALAVDNALDPGSGSNEAGIGEWSAAALPHVEARIRDAIDNWGVRYFKFDFLAWLDCAGQGDAYELHDAFVAMLDRLRADHPDVTFQIDETNDYRLWPFESVPRGPTWFQNGSPEPDHLLHNLWDLSPYIPTYAIGQHFLGGRAWQRHPVDTLMAAAMPSHLTFFDDLRGVPADVIDRAAVWIGFYKRYRSLLGGMAYPLLDDPIADGWTALQPWDPERGEGALLAFRQQSGDAERVIPLRNVPDGRRFALIEAPSGRRVGIASSAELQNGLRVSLPVKDTARVLVIRAVSG
jgi:Melibiase